MGITDHGHIQTGVNKGTILNANGRELEENWAGSWIELREKKEIGRNREGILSDVVEVT